MSLATTASNVPAIPADVRRVPQVSDNGEFAILFDTSRFEHVQRVATLFASSQLVPAHYHGKPADCFIAIEMATRLHMAPMAFMQSTYIVSGRPGMEAKLVISLLNSSGLFDGPLDFVLSGEGDDRGCHCVARLRSDGRSIPGPRVTISIAKAEGWYARNPKWKNIPDLMLQYRAASWFGRLICPERLMGMQTVEELYDETGTNGSGSTSPLASEKRGQARARELEQRLTEAELPQSGVTDSTPTRGNGNATEHATESQVSETAVETLDPQIEDAPTEELLLADLRTAGTRDELMDVYWRAGKVVRPSVSLQMVASTIGRAAAIHGKKGKENELSSDKKAEYLRDILNGTFKLA